MAWQRLGWSAAWFSEIAPFPSAVLAHHYPATRNLGDANKIHEKKEFKQHEIDVLVGGTPCQSFSIQGARKGIEDGRGRLALRFLEIAEMLRPRWLLWENVEAALCANGGKDFGILLRKLGEIGYGHSWQVLDARDFGLAQGRRRVFLVGHLGDWQRAAAVFSERKKMRGSLATERMAAPETGDAGAQKAGADRVFAIQGNVINRRFGAGPEGVGVREDLMFCLTKTDRHAVIADGIARYILPIEAERLQGLPDDYTKIPYRGLPKEECPDGLRYQVMGNAMAVPVMRWLGERIAFVDSLPDDRVTLFLPPDDLARTLSDADLVDKCVQGFRKLRELTPYLREARRRWAQPGRQVPVPGRPCWTEWITQNLHVTPRRVQQLLSEPGEISSPGQKASRRLSKGDWRALFKATENQMARVFGPLESGERFAEAIQQFAQAVADRFSERHGTVRVSVSIKTGK